MKRRKSIKTLAVGIIASGVLVKNNSLAVGVLNKPADVSFADSWKEWPDMNWAGPEYWGNRLQDWRIKDGKLQCTVRGNNRTLHCLTAQLTPRKESFESSVTVSIPALPENRSSKNYVGFRLGAKAINRFDDYRCAAVFGEGLDAGITNNGNLFIGLEQGAALNSEKTIKLILQAAYINNGYQIKLSGLDVASNKVLAKMVVKDKEDAIIIC